MSIGGLLNQSASISEPSGTRDVHGKRTLGAATTVVARFERKYKTIVTEQREKEPIHGVVFVHPGTTVSIGAKLTYDSVDYRVMTIMDQVGQAGSIHHKELMVQLWSYA